MITTPSTASTPTVTTSSAYPYLSASTVAAPAPCTAFHLQRWD